MKRFGGALGRRVAPAQEEPEVRMVSNRAIRAQVGREKIAQQESIRLQDHKDQYELLCQIERGVQNSRLCDREAEGNLRGIYGTSHARRLSSWNHLTLMRA